MPSAQQQLFFRYIWSLCPLTCASKSTIRCRLSKSVANLKPRRELQQVPDWGCFRDFGPTIINHYKLCVFFLTSSFLFRNNRPEEKKCRAKGFQGFSSTPWMWYVVLAV